MPLFGGNKKKEETLIPPKPIPRAMSASSEPVIERIGWLGLKVYDVVGEALFLEEKLGLKHFGEGNSAAGHHVRFDCETLCLELVEGGKTWVSRAKPHHGSPDVPLIASFAVDNIAQISQQLHDAKVLTTQIYEQGWVASLLFFDIERNLWQISERRNEPAVGHQDLRRIGALWLAVEDLPAQIAFYRDVLGLPLSDLGNRPRPITEYGQCQRQEEDRLPVEAGGEAGIELDFSKDEPLPEPVFSADTSLDEPGNGATFFDEGVRLALTPGGHRPQTGHEKQWGLDTSFMLGFQTNNLSGMAEKLKQAGVRVSQPFRFIHSAATNRAQQAIRFTDPEGNVWQIIE